jgi:hypothetical protein
MGACLGTSRGASISTKPGGGGSVCDRGKGGEIEAGLLLRKSLDSSAWKHQSSAGQCITVVTTGEADPQANETSHTRGKRARGPQALSVDIVQYSVQ